MIYLPDECIVIEGSTCFYCRASWFRCVEVLRWEAAEISGCAPLYCSMRLCGLLVTCVRKIAQLYVESISWAVRHCSTQSIHMSRSRLRSTQRRILFPVAKREDISPQCMNHSMTTRSLSCVLFSRLFACPLQYTAAKSIFSAKQKVQTSQHQQPRWCGNSRRRQGA